jgi:hypothetical protein
VIPPELLSGGIGAAAFGLLFWWLGTGRLGTRREIEAIRKDRDDWKAAHQTSEAARHESLRQNGEMLEHARVIDTFVRGLSQVADRENP